MNIFYTLEKILFVSLKCSFTTLISKQNGSEKKHAKQWIQGTDLDLNPSCPTSQLCVLEQSLKLTEPQPPCIYSGDETTACRLL